MPAAVSYPGVYVQEISSGVRTIVGVGTSVAMFIGRAHTGELDRPIQCLNYEDFVRAFGSEYAKSDLARSVKLFFANGGTQCYVMRIARGAQPAAVTLRNEAKAATLDVRAKSAGTSGDAIRVAVSYDTVTPEASFNMEVFRWDVTSNGGLRKAGLERYLGLSMDPSHPRYAPDVINPGSSLVSVTDRGLGASATGFSQSGFPVSAGTDVIARAQWTALIGSAATNNRFRISVNGLAPVEVDLSSIDFAVAPLDTPAGVTANLPAAIATRINARLQAGASVTVALVAGPTGPAGQSNAVTQILRVSSAQGDVRIEPASAGDLAVPLMLGAAQGGLEASRFTEARPAPTGYVLSWSDVAAFAGLRQNSFNALRIDGVDIDLSAAPYALATTGAGVTEPRMYQDSLAANQNDGRGGVREKLAIIAAAINAQRGVDPSFPYSAEVWGSRLAIVPVSGSDNLVPSVQRLLNGAVVAPALKAAADVATRYYSLGTNGAGPYQVAGAAGIDGNAPQGPEYESAFRTIDREVDLFNLMVLPKDADHSDADTRKLWGPASVFCQSRRAFLLIDPPSTWTSAQQATDVTVGVNTLRVGLVKDHAAVFYPNLRVDEGGRTVTVGPSGAIAGLMARTDSTRGVWKAPAGTEADLRGVVGLQYRFSDGENGLLNPRAVNTLRVFPNGIVNWGARTMDGDDGFGSEYKFIPIRRLALYIEESLYRGLKWVVFEPNDEPLWSQIRLNVGAFMHNLFRRGAFQGDTPRAAYFVNCDASTTTQNDRNLGIVNVTVGFAPLKPAEFVVLSLQQMAGQVQA
jgi:phage tail sheath protein FI